MKNTRTVHWPSGPVETCDRHAQELIRLASFMGSHVVSIPLQLSDERRGLECVNCVNETKSEQTIKKGETPCSEA
jgi:hypothetical protein